MHDIENILVAEGPKHANAAHGQRLLDVLRAALKAREERGPDPVHGVAPPPDEHLVRAVAGAL